LITPGVVVWLAGLGEEQAGYGTHLDPADFPASVPVAARANVQRDLVPWQGFELFEQLLLVAFHNRDVMGGVPRPCR
jgi:hypothetical protein